MKFAEEHFPMGSYKKQKSDGAFIEGILAENIDIWAKKIVDDMHFLCIISGNDQVGNGKSTLATHIGCYLTHRINELHGTNNVFTADNMLFSAEDLETKSFKLPQYSVIVLDESDDLKEHSMKEISKKLRTYFRKCRQLNQILILITPSFFELNKFYALNRSHALINVKFTGEYNRGRFDFYGPTKKKLLYLKGKKEWDYDAHKYDFFGHFAGSYFFFPNLEKETKRYRDKKYLDMMNYEKEKELELTKEQLIKETKKEIFFRVLNNLDYMTIKELAKGFGVHENTGQRWVRALKAKTSNQAANINNNSMVIENTMIDEGAKTLQVDDERKEITEEKIQEN